MTDSAPDLLKSSDYFDLMREASSVADTRILEVMTLNVAPEVATIARELVEQRCNSPKPKLRPGLFRFAYEACGGEQWQRYADAGAAFELFNLGSYSFNMLIDEKLARGSGSERVARATASIAGNLQLYRARGLLVEAARALPDPRRAAVEQEHLDLCLRMAEGLHLDVHALRRFEDFSTERYLARCFGISGSFMQSICHVAALFSDCPPEKMRAVTHFGGLYGTLIQVLNDVADLVPPDQGQVKVYRAAYSDLRGGTITLPYADLHRHGDDAARRLLEGALRNPQTDPTALREVTRAFVASGGVDRVKAFLAPRVEEARRSLARLPPSTARSWLATALDACSATGIFDRLKK